MRIGQLAAASGVSVRALRYYEEQGLLSSQRSTGGQRHYPDGAVDRVRLIQQLYAAGLPSRSILAMLPCIESGEITAALLDRLIAERDRIDHKIGDLVSARERLDAAIATAAEAKERGVPCPR